MWETVNNLIKSGFPLLGIIFYTMILMVIWRHKTDPKGRKWRWTAVVMGPPVLAVALLLILQSYPPVSVSGSIAANILVMILLVVGIPIWLLGSR